MSIHKMIMDLQTGVFCGLFSILASLIVYAILSFYSIKEDSFDEARANRRKLFKEYLDQSRTNIDKTKQKKTKRTTKKVKDKKTDLHLEEAEEKKEQKLLKEEIPKEVSAAQKDPQPLPATKKTNKASQSAPKTKPSLVDKEEPTTQSLVSAVNESNLKKPLDKKIKMKIVDKPSEVEVNPVKETIKEVTSKDLEKKIKTDVKQEKKKQDNPVSSTVLRKTPSAGVANKQVINVNSILSLIQKAELARSEVQLLIDTLLNSEDETSEWLKVKKLDSGRQDSNVKLKKQLSDLELSLKNEKQISVGLQNKLKELRSEMASDKSSVSMLKETVSKMQQERDELLYDKSELSQKLKAINDEKQEIQDKLNKEISKVQQELKIEDDRHNEAVVSLKEEINGANSKLEAVEGENVSLKLFVNSLQDEIKVLKGSQEKIGGLERSLNAVSQKLTEKDCEVGNIKKQFDNSMQLVENLKKENKEIKAEKELLHDQLSALSSELDKLKEELDSLRLKETEEEKVVCENEKGNINGFDHHDPVNCQIQMDEKEKLLVQMTKQYDTCVENFNKLKNEFSVISEEKVQLKKQVEEAKLEISDLKLKLSTVETHNTRIEETVSQLKNGLNEKTIELNSIKDEVEKYKQRNNELRSKNWKVVEALTKAEKALQNKLESEVDNGGKHKNDEELINNVNIFIKRLFPDIAIQEYQGHFNDWLRSVEEAISLNNSKNHPEDLQAQNTQLHSMVSYYKKIISETEDILNKLQSHVEIQESKWKEEISSLQQEVEILRGTRTSS